MFAVILFLVSVKCQDLPFEDDESREETSDEGHELPITRRIVPYSEMIGITEYCVVGVALFYIVFYIWGGKNMQRELRDGSKALERLRKYFYVVPSRFLRVARHEHRLYVTGRRGYLGGFVTVYFSKRSDILGWLLDKMMGRKTHVVFEFVCEPQNQLAAIFSLRKKILPYQKGYNMKERKIEEVRLSLWTDFGQARQPFVEAIIVYAKKRPGQLASVDLNDVNRFETNVAGRFVARFEFVVNSSLFEFFDDETIDFVMDIADKYNKLALPQKSYEKIVRQRAAMMVSGTDFDSKTVLDKLSRKKQ